MVVTPVRVYIEDSDFRLFWQPGLSPGLDRGYIDSMRFKIGITNEGLDSRLVAMLESAERASGESFFITSAKRAGTKKNFSSHGAGLAVDIRCSDSGKRWKMLRGLMGAGFTRLGIYDRHIHADRSGHRSNFVIWWGVSK